MTVQDDGCCCLLFRGISISTLCTAKSDATGILKDILIVFVLLYEVCFNKGGVATYAVLNDSVLFLFY